MNAPHFGHVQESSSGWIEPLVSVGRESAHGNDGQGIGGSEDRVG